VKIDLRNCIFALVIPLVLLFAWLSLSNSIDESKEPSKPRIACVGDSTTLGAFIENAELNSYPGQLATKLGDKYDVRNYGVPSGTVLKKGNDPYNKMKEYKESRKFKPNIVIINLGLNDTKGQNWPYKENFVKDYISIIKSYARLSSHPKIWICYPTPTFTTKTGIRDELVRTEVLPYIDEIAKKTGSSIIDLYAPLSDKNQLFPDSIHPSKQGSKIMAEIIYNAIIDEL